MCPRYLTICHQVRKLFKGAVEVGQRFPIVHVPMDDATHEVSTFLTEPAAHRHLPGSAGILAAAVRPQSCYQHQHSRLSTAPIFVLQTFRSMPADVLIRQHLAGGFEAPASLEQGPAEERL